MLQGYNNFKIKGLFGLDIFYNGGKLVDPFQKFEYFSRVLHRPPNFVGHICSCIPPSPELNEDF
jgi:hypothetical protein